MVSRRHPRPPRRSQRRTACRRAARWRPLHPGDARAYARLRALLPRHHRPHPRHARRRTRRPEARRPHPRVDGLPARPRDRAYPRPHRRRACQDRRALEADLDRPQSHAPHARARMGAPLRAERPPRPTAVTQRDREAAMAKFGCTCGHVIRDQTDNLPYKAELYVHQDWHAIWDYWEKHLLPLMRAGQDESQTFVDPAFPGVGLTASELKDRIWDYLIAPRTTWARTAYECEQCGRVWIQPDPDKNAYVSYLPETEKRGVLRGKAQLDGRYPMMAVVSLLDERHDLQVRALWGELARDFGPRRVTEIVRDPHVTYQGA